MVKPLATLAVMNPRLTVLELMCLARPDKPKAENEKFIRKSGVELNGQELTDPAKKVTVKTNDIFRVDRREWFRIEIVKVNITDVKLNDLETDRLFLKPMRVGDIDHVKKYLPEWEVAKYLSTPPSAKKAMKETGTPPPKEGKAAAVALKGGIPPRADTGLMTAKMTQEVAREVLKRVIMQPDPKSEWLWRISPKKEPESVIGVAHLRTASDSDSGSQNIWLAPELRDDNLMSEAMAAVNEHAFLQLGLKHMAFDQAFAFAAAPQEMEVLRRRFNGLDATARGKDTPEGVWGMTREGWDKMKSALRPGQSRSQRLQRQKKEADDLRHKKQHESQKRHEQAAHDLKKETAKKASKKPETPKPKPDRKS